MKQQRVDVEFYVTGILAIIIFLVNIRNIATLTGPWMFYDELGYLGNAAAMAGKDWHEVMQSCSWYSYGWSMILVPLFLVFSKMQIIYRCINILNAILVVAIFFMQRSLLQKIFKDNNPNVLTAIAACVCFYPGILVQSSMAMCEIWLLFVFTAITVFLYHMIHNPQTYKAAVFGALLYYFYVCHNRMIAVVIAGVLLFVILMLTGVAKKRDGLFFFGALVLSRVLFGFIKAWLVATNWPLELPSGNNIGNGLTALTNLMIVAGLKNFIKVLLSQFLYICIATCGMASLGLYASARKIIQAIKRHEIKEALLEIWLVLAFLGIFAVSVISMGAKPDISGRRLDHIFYGRYFEPTIIMFLAFGFVYLAKWENKADKKITFWTVYMCVVGICSLTSLFTVQQLNSLEFNAPNASGITAYFRLFPDTAYFILAAALLSLIGTRILTVFFSGKTIFKYIALAGFTTVCIISMYATEWDSIRPHQKHHSEEIPFYNIISTYDFADLPVYVLCEIQTAFVQARNAHVQSMLPDIPLKYTPHLSLASIPDERCYVIISDQNYATQGFDVYSETIAHSTDYVFLYVDKTIGVKPVFDYMMNTLGPFAADGFSDMEPKGRWMNENESSVACYLPSDDYWLTLDLGYAVPLEQLGMDEYSASMYINGFYLGNVVSTLDSGDETYQFKIPKEYTQDGHNTVSIRCEQLWSPSDYGDSDQRSLGLCVERILFTPTD